MKQQLLTVITILIATTSAALAAQGNFVREACSANGKQINQRVNPGLNTAARLFYQNGEFRIEVNPDLSNTYFSRDTWRWLFLRQCWFAEEFGEKSTSLLDDPHYQRDANCKALRMLHGRKASPHARNLIEAEMRKLTPPDRQRIIGSTDQLNFRSCF